MMLAHALAEQLLTMPDFEVLVKGDLWPVVSVEVVEPVDDLPYIEIGDQSS